MRQHTEIDVNFVSSRCGHLQVFYPDHSADSLLNDLITVFEGFRSPCDRPTSELWSASDCLLITYGDSLTQENRAPLQTLE